MKYIEPSNWKLENGLDGLLYFAQVLNESLFDYSIETYKPNALNGHSITHEALQICKKIKSKHLPEGNLGPIQDELVFLFSKDYAIKDILGDKHDSYSQKLKASKNFEDFSHSVFSAHTYLSGKKYLKKVKELLVEKVKEGKEKKRIYFLTRVLISELMNYGYSKSFLYKVTKDYFFNTKKQIESNDQVAEFLELFSFEPDKFSVFFQVSSNFWEFRNTLKNVDFKLTKDLRDKDKNVILKTFNDKKPNEFIYVIAHDIEALEHNSALENARARLNFFINLFHVFHHRTSLLIHDSSAIYRESDHYTLIVQNENNPLLKHRDVPAKEADNKVDKMLRNLSFPRTNNSLERLIKALELHKLALKTNETENQLLDLWAALETLIQKQTESNKYRIEQISSALIPFLSIGYIKNIVIELFKDLSNWNSTKFYAILEKVDTDSGKRLVSFLKILTMPDFDALKTEILSQLTKYPLIKNRIYLYNKWFSDTNEMKKMIDRHSQKVSWQIRRIYRARNMVIHHGGKPNHLETLIENLNGYIHHFVFGLNNMMQEIKIRSIEHGIIEMDIAFRELLDLLETEKVVNEDNIEKVFRINNAL